MKKKQFIKYIILIFAIIVSCCLISEKLKQKPQEYISYVFEASPSFISTSDNEELFAVVNGKLVCIDSELNATTIQLDFEIAKVYSCKDWLWIIDDRDNLYTMKVFEDNTYELSDVILEHVQYVNGNGANSIAITTDGNVYVWGKGDEFYSAGLGEDEEIIEPTQIENISNAKEVVRFYVNTAILTEDGDLYVVGASISTEFSETHQEFLTTTELIKEFTKVENISDVAHIGEYEGLYTFSDDGAISEWECIRVNEAGQVVLDSSQSDWDCDLQFTQLSFGGQFVIGLDVEGNVYYWGYDFTREMKNKADYTIYSTPQLLELDKPVDSVYAAGDIAFFKSGLELYVILKD